MELDEQMKKWAQTPSNSDKSSDPRYCPLCQMCPWYPQYCRVAACPMPATAVGVAKPRATVGGASGGTSSTAIDTTGATLLMMAIQQNIVDIVNDERRVREGRAQLQSVMGTNKKWDGTWDKSRYTAGVDPASGPDETVICVTTPGGMNWFHEFFRERDRVTNMLIEAFQLQPEPTYIGYLRVKNGKLYFPLLNPRLNSYQRRRARKPWLYERKS